MDTVIKCKELRSEIEHWDTDDAAISQFLCSFFFKDTKKGHSWTHTGANGRIWLCKEQSPLRQATKKAFLYLLHLVCYIYRYFLEMQTMHNYVDGMPWDAVLHCGKGGLWFERILWLGSTRPNSRCKSDANQERISLAQPYNRNEQCISFEQSILGPKSKLQLPWNAFQGRSIALYWIWFFHGIPIPSISRRIDIIPISWKTNLYMRAFLSKNGVLQ